MDLTALQHSAFLQALGWAIANSLWQAAILWGLYQLINATYRTASARFRSNSATIFLFSTFAWFVGTFLLKFFTLSGGGPRTLILSEAQLVQLSEYLNQPGNFINWQQLTTDASAALPYLSVAYLLLLIIFCSRWTSAYRHTSFIRSSGLEKPGVEWRLFTDKSAMHIGIHKKIRIWFSKHVDVPATIGYLKPVILIPIASLNQLSVEQLEAIILHELAHIKRNDYLLNLFVSIIETFLFFNPFVVLLAKVLKRERENFCDDFVIQYQYDRHSYASALLSIERYRLQQHRLAMSATSGKKQLLVRVRRIMENNQGHNGLNYGQKLVALFLITGMIISLAWLSPSDKNTIISSKKGDTPATLPIPKGDHLAHFAQRESIVSDLREEISKNLTSKDIADITMLVEKQVKPMFGHLMETAIKEIPSAFAIERIESVRVPDLNKTPAWEKPDPKFTLSFNQDYQNHLLNPSSFNQQAVEAYFNKLSTAVDVEALQANLEKAKIEMTAVDWKKISAEVQLCLDNVQKEFERLPAELKKNVPVIQKMMIRDEFIKSEAEIKKLVKVRSDVGRLRTLSQSNLYLAKTDSLRLHRIPRSKIFKADRDYLAEQDVGLQYAYTAAPAATPEYQPSVHTAPNAHTYTFKMDNTYEYGVPEIVELRGTGDKKFSIEFKEGFLFINGEKIRIKDIKEKSKITSRNRKTNVCAEKEDEVEN